MNAILDPEMLADRAGTLDGLGKNGFRLAYVTLDPTDPPLFATLDVEFVNTQALAPLPAKEAFVVAGGVRRNRSAVLVTAVAVVAIAWSLSGSGLAGACRALHRWRRCGSSARRRGSNRSPGP